MNTYEYEMASLSRFTSQGRQQTNVYTPRQHNLDAPLPLPRPRLARQNARAWPPASFPQFDINFDTPTEYEIDNYQIDTARSISCYSTQTVLETMTQIQGTNDEDTAKI
jgi:hypothetical protein